MCDIGLSLLNLCCASLSGRRNLYPYTVKRKQGTRQHPQLVIIATNVATETSNEIITPLCVVTEPNLTWLAQYVLGRITTSYVHAFDISEPNFDIFFKR